MPNNQSKTEGAATCSASEYVPGIGCQCAAHNADECGCRGVDWTPREVYQLRSALGVAMTTLRQIASTPRNRGARRNADATVAFLETQMPNSERSDRRP
jgi:hypothetical protein